MDEKIICEHCGKELEENEIHEAEGETLCEDCFCDDYVTCDECGEICNRNNVKETSDGSMICETCFENDYFICDDCGEIHKRDEENKIYDTNGCCNTTVCNNCSENYYRCDDCRRLFASDCMEEVGCGSICINCLENGNYNTCHECGEWFLSYDLMYCERDDEYYCEDCYPQNGVIADYHDHENELEFFGDNKSFTVPYLGVELEIDKGRDNDSCAEYTAQCFPHNFIYFEYDGSLSSGFENITQPATLEYHYGLKDNYDDMFKNAVRSGFRSHQTTTCGLHIHFNRDFYASNEELYVTRLLYLVEKFWDELVKFSRRDIDSLNRWSKKYDKTPEEVVNEWKNNSWCLNRYQAINLTNENTIEFRMFRGTLKLNTFIATLQLCDTLVKTAKNIENTEAIQNLKWEDMLQYDEIKTYWEEVKNR